MPAMAPRRGIVKRWIQLGPYELYLSLDPFELSEALRGLCVKGEVGPGAVYLTQPLYSTVIAALIVDDEGHATLIGSDSSIRHFSSVEDASEFVRRGPIAQ